MAKTYAPKLTTARGHTMQVGNMEMYYEECGTGQALLLLHGYGGCVKNWYPFIDGLSPHYRLIIADLRGHGYSTNPGNAFTHREAAGDVFLLLEKLGIVQFSAMGMSTGGMVLLHMATQQPSRISAMVLISATTRFPEQARAIMRRASFDTMPPEVRDMYLECAGHGDLQIRRLIEQFNALSENHDDMNFSAQSLSVITARTLVVHGDRDNFFPAEIALSIYRAISHSALWIIPNGDHVPVYDAGVPFISTALKFLKNGGISHT